MSEVEVKAENQEGGAPAVPEKTKKINKLSLEKLNLKIKEIEESNKIQSKYYKHLLQRKSELEPPPAAE